MRGHSYRSVHKLSYSSIGVIMKTRNIFSKNADYQRFEVLKHNRNKRYKYNEFFVEGVKNINSAILNNWKIVSFIYTREKTLSDWAENILKTVKTSINYELTSQLMADLSEKNDTSELIAIVAMRADDLSKVQLSHNPLIAVFDRASNKGNLGTIIRSCDALGIDVLILTGHSVDLYDTDVIVSSMGSFFRVQVIRVTQNNQLFDFINNLREKYSDFKAIGTTAHKQFPLYQVDLTVPSMIFIGNETEGLCNTYKENCDYMVTIPMAEQSSATSFNVACAATVLFYEAARQRAESQRTGMQRTKCRELNAEK